MKGTFGDHTKIVFDGYPSAPTTKDTTHLKRTKGKKGRLVKFSHNTKLTMSKDKFPLNKENKQVFLQGLTSYMNLNGIESVQSYADADVLIATTAIETTFHTGRLW